jgi:hypothetical protein
MRPRPFDLAEFFGDLAADEHAVQQFCREVVHRLISPLGDVAGWPMILADVRRDIDDLAADNTIGVGSASSMHFVTDLLEAAAISGTTPHVPRSVAGLVAGAVISDRQWREVIQAMARDRGIQTRKLDYGRPPVMQMLGEILSTLYDRGERDVIRLLYTTIRGRVHRLRRMAQRESGTYDEWLTHLATLSVFLIERNGVPVTEPAGGIGSWHPLAEWAFSSDELGTMRRDEAFFSEQFAHLFTVVAKGAHLRETLNRLAADVSAVDRAGRQAKREELRLMRARYEIPPYLFTQLDQQLT